MIKWVKEGRIVSAERTINIYRLVGTQYTVQSRKRLIPHAGGRSGGWWHTSYFVLRDGKELIEKYSLKDAKDYVEKLNITDKGETT